MNRLAFSTLWCCCAAWVGCVGTETGNPPTNRGTSIQLALHSSDVELISTRPADDEEPAEYMVTDAHMGLVHLSATNCLEQRLDLVAELISVDLVATFLVGTPEGLPAGDYCALEFQVGPAVLGYQRPGSPPALTLGVHLRSALSDVSIESDLVALMPLHLREGQFSVQEGDRLVLALDMAKWLGPVLTGLDLPDTALGGNANQGTAPLDLPSYVIDSAGAPELSGRLNASFPGSFLLFVDRDGDGLLSPGEVVIAHSDPSELD